MVNHGVTCGNKRKAIFHDDADRRHFLNNGYKATAPSYHK